MEKMIITGGKFILPEGIVEGVSAVCDVKTGKILEIKANGEVEPDSSDVVIDAAGRYVSPGFVDIHVHGGGGFDIMDGNVRDARDSRHHIYASYHAYLHRRGAFPGARCLRKGLLA